MSVNDGGDPSVTPQRELALVCPLPQRQLVLLCPHHITIIYVIQAYSLDVCGRVYVCTQAFIGFLAFELLVNNASSGTLAFSLRLVDISSPCIEERLDNCPYL